MKRFGEIGRVKSENIEYIIFSHKYEYGQLDIPWFDIMISRKSVKRNKLTSQYNLLEKTFNIAIMRNIEKVIFSYLVNMRPDYVAISAHEKEFEKRISLYTKRLNSMNYFVKEVVERVYFFECKMSASEEEMHTL